MRISLSFGKSTARKSCMVYSSYSLHSRDSAASCRMTIRSMNIVELPLTEEVSGFETSASPSCAWNCAQQRRHRGDGSDLGPPPPLGRTLKRSSLSSSKDTGQPVLSLNYLVGRNISEKFLRLEVEDCGAGEGKELQGCWSWATDGAIWRMLRGTRCFGQRNGRVGTREATRMGRGFGRGRGGGGRGRGEEGEGRQGRGGGGGQRWWDPEWRNAKLAEIRANGGGGRRDRSRTSGRCSAGCRTSARTRPHRRRSR